jgi:ABC-2 type transport system ATP-binding protein
LPVSALEPVEASAARAPYLLALEGVVKKWPGAPPLLDGIDLSLERGQAVAVSGRNGAGKTTLLRIAAGLISPERGSVNLDGLDVDRDRTEYQRRLGFVSAGNSGLYARLKTEQHLELWSRLSLLPRKKRGVAIERVREQFSLGPLWGQRVDRLSMGQRQRLRLALAFLPDPRVVLLDEPTTSLDDEGAALLSYALESLKARGGAAIVCLPSGWERLAAVDVELVLADGDLVST